MDGAEGASGIGSSPVGTTSTTSPNSIVPSGSPARESGTSPRNCPTIAFRAARPGVQISASRWRGPITGVPSGFPPMHLAADHPFHPAPTEFDQPLAGNFCAAAVGMAYVFEKLQEQ